MIVVDELADEWRKVGVVEGDMLLLHSRLKRLLRRLVASGCAPDPALVIESFLAALGPSGTLLLPLFNFDFAKGVEFDIRNTPSHMGTLTECGRKWPGAVRTGHPIYSFAVIGKNSEAFRGLKNFSGYGVDSPFAMLHHLGGKIGVIDLPDQNSMTFYHYVEERLNVPYRYHKIFMGSYIDEDGTKADREFGLFVRDIGKGIRTHVNPMGNLLWDQGLYSGNLPNEGAGLRVIPATKLFNSVAEVITEGRAEGILYVTEH